MIGAKADYEFRKEVIVGAIEEAAESVLISEGERLVHEIKGTLVPRPRASRPGEPPRSVTGKLRDNIVATYDRREMSVVIGPAPLGIPGDVPAELEETHPYLNPVFQRYLPKIVLDWHNVI